ncbi:2-dehydropantoate 2-reductase (Ketopantoate reductase) (KPA reductase) (KPR) [Microsporum canis]|uniref:2-dehydropantoate 2-reductase n=1 Tax=Arthroderma otae (strain ATCC MYA-4605 / CBS 113480) TaxID=554155 RepID=C5FZH4_ARTOC|nr:2-dehydropantoate 2-reductase [Microsporum canis CBS 113480]EEQ35277.1 2-dehydropantoate 2-reductase [Microsporum canis CBS 113480]
MGVGNIGSFVAHSLASRSAADRARLTLLFHHPAFYKDWNRFGRVMAVKRHGIPEQRSGFCINVLQDEAWYYPSEIADAPPELVKEELALREGEQVDGSGQHVPADEEWIEHLIVTVKTTQVEKALLSVRHRLSPDSSVLFLTNGLGVLEEVNEKIWPEEKQRPNYLFGITTHGLYKSGLFETTHAGVGTTTIGVVRQSHQEDTEDNTSLAPSTAYLLKALTGAPELACISTNATDLLLLQLEKLAVNCVINPLTVLMDCKNGELLYNYNLTRVQRLLLIEVSAVICALPELQGVPGLQVRFSPERLRTLAVGVAGRTAENTSSMLQDARLGKESEIEYMNGYIVRRGEEVGVRCALNYMVVQLAQAKSRISGRKKADEVPFDLSRL